MSVFSVKMAESQVSQKLNTFLADLEKQKRIFKSENELTSQAKVNRINNFKVKSREPILESLKHYAIEYEITEKELERTYNKQILVFQPITTMEEILFYSKLNYFKDIIADMSIDQIFEGYDKEVEPWKLQVYEMVSPTILKHKQSSGSKAIRLKNIIEKNQKERLSEALKTDLQYMEDHKPIYNNAERFIRELEMSPQDIPPVSIYVWLQMTGKLQGKDKHEIVSAEEVADRMRTTFQ